MGQNTEFFRRQRLHNPKSEPVLTESANQFCGDDKITVTGQRQSIDRNRREMLMQKKPPGTLASVDHFQHVAILKEDHGLQFFKSCLGLSGSMVEQPNQIRGLNQHNVCCLTSIAKGNPCPRVDYADHTPILRMTQLQV